MTAAARAEAGPRWTGAVAGWRSGMPAGEARLGEVRSPAARRNRDLVNGPLAVLGKPSGLLNVP